MAAILYLSIYLACGILCAGFLLPRLRMLPRLWLGLSLGVLMMMWLPALIAFVDAFSLRGHLIALVLLLALTALCYAIREKGPVRPWQQEDTKDARLLLFIALPTVAERQAAIAYAHRAHILTVSDAKGFAEQGGIIQMTRVAQNIQIKINYDAALTSGLRIAAPLLSIATVLRKDSP